LNKRHETLLTKINEVQNNNTNSDHHQQLVLDLQHINYQRMQIHYQKRQISAQQLDTDIQSLNLHLTSQLQQLSAQQVNMNNEHYMQYYQQLTYQTQHLSLQSQLLQLTYSQQTQMDPALLQQYQTQLAYQTQQLQIQYQLELLRYQYMGDEERRRYQSELESQLKQIQYYLHQLQQNSTAATNASITAASERQEPFDPRSTDGTVNPNSIQVAVVGGGQVNFEDNSAAGVRPSQVDLNAFSQPVVSQSIDVIPASNQS